MPGVPVDPAALLAAIVQSSHDAIVGKSLDGTVFTWNAAAEDIFGWRAHEMVGQSIRRIIPDARQAEEDVILASIRAGQRVPSFETVRLHKDGREVHVAVTVSPVCDSAGQVIGASKIARDITEARLVQSALEESELRFRLMADNISQLAWIAGPDGGLTWYNRRWYEYTGASFSEMRGWGWRALHHPDHLARVDAKFTTHIASGEPWEDTFPLRGAEGAYRWFLSRAHPLKGADGAVLCWFGTNTDITEQLEAERRIELLMLEVNHRSKNMLAMIQSLARRSAHHGNDDGNADFVRRLEQRISCLAANQDLLVRRSWSDVPLGELVEAQLAFLGEALAQVDRDGPPLPVTPGAAETLGMALHELATNALKYGALSQPGGRVALHWSRGENGGLVLTWRETGGPPVTAPVQPGFGSRLITDMPRGKLRAEVTVDFAREGFAWRLVTPADRVLS
ncbi:MAG: PAS domain S-box protein [Sphingomonadales bacterium]|nr:PAS domain S-box protein [Sphingomonadales bacterium]